MLEWLIIAAILFVGFDALAIGLGWFALAVIKPRYPEWWQQTVVDRLPEP